MHITRDEFFHELAKFTDWVNQQHADVRRRLARIEQKEAHDMGIITDDLGALEGLVSQVESELQSQKNQIDTLVSAEGDAPADHQELVDGHNRLSVVVQSLRDAVSALNPETPVSPIATPAPGSDTPANTPGTDGGAGLAAASTTQDVPPNGGESVVVDDGSGSADTATAAVAGVNAPTPVDPSVAPAPSAVDAGDGTAAAGDGTSA